MRSMSNSRGLKALLGVVVVSLVGACSDGIFPPLPPESNTIGSTLTTSVWRVEGAELADLGAFELQVQVTNGTPHTIRALGDVKTMVWSPAEGASRKTAVGSSIGPILQGLEAPGEPGTLGIQQAPRPDKPSKRSKTFGRTAPNGDQLRIELIPDPRGERYPDLAFVLFRNNRIQNIVQFVREGGSRNIVGVRSISIGEKGATTVTQTDFADQPGESVDQVAGVLGVLKSGLSVGCASAVGLLGPEPLLADELGCQDEENDVIYRAAEFAIAEALYIAAVAGCAVGATCPTIPILAAAMGLALARLRDAEMAREACYQAEDPPFQPPIVSPGAGSNFVPTEWGCTTIVWEISYDGGLSWHYLSTEVYCS